MSREQLTLFAAPVPAQAPAQTLTEALRAAGYTHRPPVDRRAPLSHREVVDASGRVVFTGNWEAAWAWLTAGRSGR